MASLSTGVFNLYPQGHQFRIDSASDSKGKFSGRIIKWKDSSGSDDDYSWDIEGGYHYHNEAGYTEIRFSAKGFRWVLTAYYRGGERYFETWNAIRTSEANPPVVAEMEFHMDLSADGQSLFGDKEAPVKG